MSRSRKKYPITTIASCKSQKKGKTLASRRFRRTANHRLATEDYDDLPQKSIELTESWDLGGDGKQWLRPTGEQRDDQRRFAK